MWQISKYDTQYDWFRYLVWELKYLLLGFFCYRSFSLSFLSKIDCCFNTMLVFCTRHELALLILCSLFDRFVRFVNILQFKAKFKAKLSETIFRSANTFKKYNEIPLLLRYFLCHTKDLVKGIYRNEQQFALHMNTKTFYTTLM